MFIFVILSQVRAVMGPQAYLLGAYEELWEKDLTDDVENILKFVFHSIGFLYSFIAAKMHLPWLVCLL